MTKDYKRNGTTTLFSALNVLDGQVIGQCQQSHSHAEWLKFLRKIDREAPKDKTLHLIADNYATRKRPAVQDWLAKHRRFNMHLASALRPEEWLLIEWPEQALVSDHYWFSTAPADAMIDQLVLVAGTRRRIERDYRELKQKFGWSQYAGRNRRGFHHHATLCIAAYDFLTAHRLAHDAPRKAPRYQKSLPYPVITPLADGRRAQRHVTLSIRTLRHTFARVIARRLPRCPCCGAVEAHIRRK